MSPCPIGSRDLARRRDLDRVVLPAGASRPGRHAGELFAADGADTDGTSWTYLPYGPFDELETYTAWVSEVAARDDPYFYAIIDTEQGSPTQDRAAGVLSLLRITPDAGSIEVGHIHLSPALQQTRASTEAQFLIMTYVFDDLGYRRYEWKCDALNAPSRRAAERLGFTYEGIFRQSLVYKGRNRDTAWYAIIDADWPRGARGVPGVACAGELRCRRAPAGRPQAAR